MIASGAPYVCAQLPLLDRHPEQGPESSLTGCILALSGVVLYCSYQVMIFTSSFVADFVLGYTLTFIFLALLSR